ncbi:TPA: integrating conjugative element protein [Pseudomonas putida]|jgi:integrating conjugative element protein (TIGR03765 family)|uniref:Integrating conjugative element protein n=2 Tax=Pseudomonas TaxID=286 RepID=A0ACD4PDQ6_9PSED|nr:MULTISPECIES: integrating conjugative element protein [Pseudomonas]MCE0778815.1 integrating conjugative element protein [Pseudomonas sp. NMI542_15]MCE0863521.1 integrating conjugative element protein [Pseudomonas alloputida]MCE0868871.1 integrating conjugative element protein [Pseudomonas alloputida]MCE0890337.1 integrating conjugative element protein [Pseudomonas alloputida]MCE0909108.1 integrating conjugative element protein [Pseudomonas kurunegalensis]
MIVVRRGALICGLMGSLAAGAWLGPTPPVIAAESATAVERPDPRTLNWVLPVHSARLTPGEVPRRALDLPGMVPLFLVGADAASLAWLTQHAPALKRLGANGLAVEVVDAAALQRIQAVAPGLAIWPVSGDDIAERLELEHYPVLITPTGMVQ